MTSSHEPPRDSVALTGMEGLIAAMKGQRARAVATPLLSAPVGTRDDERLAAAAWRAMHQSPPSDEDREHAAPSDAGAYLEPGTTVGRYVVLRRLGTGGMGVVYVAYDPELDRRVALKLVLPGRAGEDGRMRLLREAQALAKLSHPNVVAVHDVGTMGEQVWLAMELVRGQTLRAWFEQRHHWRQVLAVMRRAARGLAAAHAAGLLHRDFKPDNVMVDERGRVRVMDFGLARAQPLETAPSAAESMAETSPSVDTLALRVTQAGALVGTPLYMAPEQHLGRELTPAVDQFALCVSLWEGLYGERPFRGDTLEELLGAMLTGRVQEPAKSKAVPSWLRRVCERGLAVDPRQRFASIDALLAALVKARARARVRAGLVALGMVAAIGLGAGASHRYGVAQATAACETRGAEIEAAWSPTRRQALHDALVATGVSYATTTADAVMPWLDRQATAWRHARVEACLDTEVRDTWDVELHDRAQWCLDERRLQLEALVDELTRADETVVAKAVPAAASLRSVAPCRDAKVLEALVAPPVELRGQLRAVQAEVARVDALDMAGRPLEGLERAREALVHAEALAWPSLVAVARSRVGLQLMRNGKYAEAEATLEDAYFAATEGVAPEVVFDSARMLVAVVGYDLTRHAEGRRWARHAEAARAGVHDGDELRRASLLIHLALVQMSAAEHADAKAKLEEAVAIQERALGPDHLNVALSLVNLASVERALGHHQQAKALYSRTLWVFEESLGPHHPLVAKCLGNLGAIHQDAGAFEEAKALHERALAILERAQGSKHPDVALSLGNLAVAHEGSGDYAKARALLERALAIREATLGASHPSVATTLDHLANVHANMGDYAEAKALFERALSIREAALGPDHPSVAESLHNVAGVHAALGAYEDAKRLDERALAIGESALGPKHPTVARSLSSLAEVLEALGAYEDARALHERAIAIREESLGADHIETAFGLNNLANLYRAMGAYEDARALHERALAIKEKVLGPHHPNVASSLTNLANVHEAMGSHAEAKRLYERALAIREAAWGPDHPDLAYSLLGLAKVALAQGEPGNAVSLATRAVALWANGRPVELAEARFVLARARWDAPTSAGRDRALAIAVAGQARDALPDAGEGEAARLRAEVERWLDAHGND